MAATYLVDIAEVDDGEVLDALRYLEERFILAHAVLRCLSARPLNRKKEFRVHPRRVARRTGSWSRPKRMTTTRSSSMGSGQSLERSVMADARRRITEPPERTHLRGSLGRRATLTGGVGGVRIPWCDRAQSLSATSVSATNADKEVVGDPRWWLLRPGGLEAAGLNAPRCGLLCGCDTVGCFRLRTPDGGIRHGQSCLVLPTELWGIR